MSSSKQTPTQGNKENPDDKTSPQQAKCHHEGCSAAAVEGKSFCAEHDPYSQKASEGKK
jgi:hypothetical protein